ncbi:MAG: NAD(P)H-hydrate dehydratase [Verrucomicrobiota bacterium]|jgi:ADP-dependent NAD(P)H-hydrate dehydratase / NAD(P)H-hydrate epimerase
MPAPVISVAQMRQWEQATWAAGRTETEVISRVGHLVTQRARLLTRPGDLILVLAGKGHNGDDARYTSQNLNDREVALINIAGPVQGLADFKSELSVPAALIIDGVFGIGLNRPLNAEWVRFIEAINETQLPILSIDVPSGLNADTGDAEGAAVRATVTLTLGAPKKGLLKQKAWPFVRRLEVEPHIGLIPCPIRSETQWILPEDFAGYPPARRVDTHKGAFGHVGILAGSVGYHGAAILAARGALRARPGLVTLATPQPAYVPIASQLQMAMVHPWSSQWQWPDSMTAIVCGPGLAARDLPESIKQHVAEFWKHSPCHLLVDASGLAFVPPGPISSNALRVLTPHPGEAARLLETTSADVQNDRIRAVRELSKKFANAWIILKGHQTVIGRSTGDIFINSSGNPNLAQGGSGDVLAGYLGGLLAQPGLEGDPAKLLRFGVWQHGATADDLERARANWTVEELLDQLGNAQV